MTDDRHPVERHIGAVYDHVARVLASVTRERGLTIEIGCGGKLYTPHIRGTHVGMDRTTDLYKGPGPDVIGDAVSLPFRDGIADVAFCVGVFCLISDQVAMLRECRRVLAPEGRLFIFDYNRAVVERLAKASGARYVAHTPWSLLRLLGRTGFDARLIARRRGRLRPLMHVPVLSRLLVLTDDWLMVEAHKHERP